MWVVVYGRRWVYLQYKDIRFETKSKVLAYIVYSVFFVRYCFTMFPVKSLKMYKVTGEILDFKNYKRFKIGG